ncbi:hypothetical protein BH09PLA1_BH09PLA1_21370 [soil metagenome]
MGLLDSVSILMVCLDRSHPDHSHTEGAREAETREAVHDLQAQASVVHSGMQALEMLRMTEFDLIVTAPRLPDIPIWEMVQSIRSLWPWQKWALVGTDVTAHEEVRARMLGVTGVFDRLPGAPMLAELARAVRRRTETWNEQSLPRPAHGSAGSRTTRKGYTTRDQLNRVGRPAGRMEVRTQN